jgi:hypothetical protein
MRHDNLSPVTTQIPGLAISRYYGSNRHLQHQLLAILTMLLATTTRLTILRSVSIAVTKVSQRRQTVICFEDHVTASATIAPIRPTTRHELLPPEAGSPITTAA